MKKILLIIGFFLIITVAVVRLYRVHPDVATYPMISSPTPMSVGQLPTVVEATRPSVPSKLSIPSIGVEASVEEVGLDQNGKMDVPKKNEDAGWYNLGYRPGEKGSAVIAGHYDTVTGAPAVFYNLSKLKKGDEIQVTDQSSNTYKYVVRETQTYPYDQLPLEEIFGSHDKGGLNLITCEGIFNQATHNYSNRTVVFADLSS